MKMHPVTDGENTIGHVREDEGGTRFEARHYDGTTSPVFNDRTAASDWVYRHEANHPAFPKETILVRRGEPVLDSSVLDEAAHLIEQLYPGVWQVQPYGDDFPYDYALRTVLHAPGKDLPPHETNVLGQPIGHENLAGYFALVQPSTVRGLIADNKRLRLENAQLRQGKTTWPES